MGAEQGNGRTVGERLREPEEHVLRLDEARVFVEQLRQLEKPPDWFAQMKARPEWAAEITSMLRKAGLPE